MTEASWMSQVIKSRRKRSWAATVKLWQAVSLRAAPSGRDAQDNFADVLPVLEKRDRLAGR